MKREPNPVDNMNWPRQSPRSHQRTQNRISPESESNRESTLQREGLIEECLFCDYSESEEFDTSESD